MDTFEFNDKLHEWAEKVVRECSAIATNPAYEMNLCFYPLQSGVRCRPEILFILTNPGSNGIFDRANTSVENSVLRTDRNEFLHCFPGYGCLTKLFTGDILLPLYEKAVIVNMLYFNSMRYSHIQKRKGYLEALRLCQDLTLEFIKLVQPKTIIALGKPAEYWMAGLTNERRFKEELAEDGHRLIGKATYKGIDRDIPVFCLHHPSTRSRWTRPYNTGINLERKRAWFEACYKQEIK
jgi:hypothetical protein